jgi:hypothetical protein
MESPMRAVELSGHLDAAGQLHLDEPLRGLGAGRVRVLILLPEEQDVDQAEWLRAAAGSSAFDFLRDPEEEVYDEHDGKPFDASTP